MFSIFEHIPHDAKLLDLSIHLYFLVKTDVEGRNPMENVLFRIFTMAVI